MCGVRFGSQSSLEISASLPQSLCPSSQFLVCLPCVIRVGLIPPLALNPVGGGRKARGWEKTRDDNNLTRVGRGGSKEQNCDPQLRPRYLLNTFIYLQRAVNTTNMCGVRFGSQSSLEISASLPQSLCPSSQFLVCLPCVIRVGLIPPLALNPVGGGRKARGWEKTRDDNNLTPSTSPASHGKFSSLYTVFCPGLLGLDIPKM